jgi:hypothetical protein
MTGGILCLRALHPLLIAVSPTPPLEREIASLLYLSHPLIFTFISILISILP